MLRGFDGFAGNTRVLSALRRAAAPGSRFLRHAYLLYGTAGTGKKTLAAILAAALVCTGEGERPCGQCPACKKSFGSLGHPDVLTFRTPEGKTQFPVELVRKAREEAYIRPTEGERKVIVFENAERMNAASANALLKVLEEPPPSVVFILTCDNLGALPETIPSRCVPLELHEPAPRRAEQWLLAAYPDAPPDKLDRAMLCGGGNIGRAVRYLEDEKAAAVFADALSLLQAMAGGREFDLLAVLARYEGDRAGVLELLASADRLAGETARAAFLPADRIPAALAARISPARAEALHRLILDIRGRMQVNVSGSLLLAYLAGQMKGIMERPV